MGFIWASNAFANVSDVVYENIGLLLSLPSIYAKRRLWFPLCAGIHLKFTLSVALRFLKFCTHFKTSLNFIWQLLNALIDISLSEQIRMCLHAYPNLRLSLKQESTT